jgi:putative beta barrel porin BBP7
LMLPDDLGLQVNNFFGADDVGVRYTSDVHSFEANLVHCCCSCNGCGQCHSIEWLAGFRYLNLDEEFRLSSFDSQEGTSIYKVETENNLYGVQIGSRYRGCSGGYWSWETTGKAGIYGNDMEQSQAPIVDFPAFVFRTRRGSDESDVAFVGELNATAIYHLSRMWGLRAGYNLIWIEGVALAPEQLDFTNTPDSGRKLVDGGGVFLHGVNVGVEARW